MTISIIAAVASNGVIGKDNDLPWHLPNDMAFFKRKTKGHHVITGRKNYESIPERFRPLPGRPNIVISSNTAYHAPGAHVFGSLEEGIAFAQENGEKELFIIGGGQIYKQTLEKGLAHRLYITRIIVEPEGDVRFPEIDRSSWKLVDSEAHEADERNPFDHIFETYERVEGTP